MFLSISVNIFYNFSGIEIKTWQVKEGDDKIVYNVWDFAGQTVYYNTHQVPTHEHRKVLQYLKTSQ